ncbi:MAG TPA: hypothetical protein VJP04_15610 [Terriglobales bacterium]|nr:hypothetical protein [Terriglobales bacterium]
MPKILFLLCLVAGVVCSAQEMPQGPPLSSGLLVSSPRPQHRFFDKTSLALHSWNVVAETYDALTTRRALGGQPIHELNPFGALFVNHGWGGQAVFSYGFGVGGPMLTSYLLHRTGHHKLERWVVAINALGSTTAGSWNLSH